MPSCENIYALSIVTAFSACPFSIKKVLKSVFFYVLVICWRLRVSPPDPLPNPGCATEQKEWTQTITGKASN